jgi:hypothetical protein
LVITVPFVVTVVLTAAILPARIFLAGGGLACGQYAEENRECTQASWS